MLVKKCKNLHACVHTQLNTGNKNCFGEKKKKRNVKTSKTCLQFSSGVPFLVRGVGAGIAKQYIQTGMEIGII